METKKRLLELELTDDECLELAHMAGRAGLTIAHLVENFIADLTSSIRSNGSDERDFALHWFVRCGFSEFAGENDLVKFLCGESYIDHSLIMEYSQILDDLETDQNVKVDASNHPDKYDPEEVEFRGDFFSEMDQLADLRESWHPDSDVDLNAEHARVKAWMDDYHKFTQNEGYIVCGEKYYVSTPNLDKVELYFVGFYFDSNNRLAMHFTDSFEPDSMHYNVFLDNPDYQIRRYLLPFED